MITTRTFTAIAVGALILAPGVATAQSGSSEPSGGAQEDRVGAILGTLFGDRLGVSTSVERQWAAGRKPLATQRTQFIARIDADVRSGALTARNGTRVKADYEELVALEARYGALTQALTEGGYADEDEDSDTLSVADGRTEFHRRVDAAVAARRLSRTEATRVKSDYAALIQTEATYARDGISRREREDLDARLDALDTRVGDTAYGGGSAVLDNRTRLSNVDRALGTSGLNAAAQTQLRVELGDLTRLDAAYSRATPSSDDKAYLERRIADLETRARVRR